MITSVELKNFGPLETVTWKKLGPINLVIGGNGSGKTFLLKSLYSAMRTLPDGCVVGVFWSLLKAVW